MNVDLNNLKMINYLRPCKIGNVAVDHFVIEKELPAQEAQRLNIPPPGEYARLKINCQTYMSDTPDEKMSNKKIVELAHGDVLVGGLGLGLILMAIQEKAAVNSITVIENNADVIEAVGSQLPLNSKISIELADVFTYTPRRKFDIIYLDIWQYIDLNIYEKEMLPLKDKYRNYLKRKSESPDRKIFCWAEKEAKRSDRSTPQERMLLDALKALERLRIGL